jgi:nucleotide-binding universal stress UspA family protein
MIAIRNILIPIDFSEPAEAALEYAKALAAEFGSHLHLLHVIPEPFVYPWGAEGAALPLGEMIADAERATRQRLEQLIPPSDPLAGRVTVTSELGVPFDRILRYIDEHAIDLVVMGTHGRGAMGHFLLGSVTERVVRKGKAPVLTVHEKPKA